MIVGKKINLRVMKESDLNKYIELTNDVSEVGEFFPVIIRTEHDTRKIYQENGFFGPDGGRMLITNKNDEILGFVSYFKTNFYMNGYELGYQIFRRENRGKGYMSEAVRLFSAFMFESKPITRLQICMNVNNIGSAIVAEKSGYTFEGIAREVEYEKGELVSNKQYSLVRGEVKSLKETIKEINNLSI